MHTVQIFPFSHGAEHKSHLDKSSIHGMLLRHLEHKALSSFILSAILGFGVLWSISFAVQMTSFWLVNIWSLITIKNVFVNVLSGSMIPLWFMPEWMSGVMSFTPFSSIYFTPVQIYLGQLSFSEIALKCAVQLVWIIIIYFIGNILWKKGQQKLVVQGG